MSPHSFDSLRPLDGDGRLRVVIETPRGSRMKYTFDQEMGAFTVGRQLMTGLAYPYDWGFVPGTRADDGDPLDAMVLHPHSTYPGVVLHCLPLGLVLVEQKDEGPWIRNDRVLACPAWHGTGDDPRDGDRVPARMISELEQFFVNTSYFTARKIRIVGWRGPKAALRAVERAARRRHEA